MNGSPEKTLVEDERRWRLRRLDDLLEALETCNEQEISHPPRPILDGLHAAGIEATPEDTTTQLIELVLDRQADYLIKVPIERRKSPRRRTKPDIEAWLRESRGEPKPPPR